MANPLIYPYPVLADAPDLRVANPRLDGAPTGELLPREDLIDLHSIEGPWTWARLNARLQLPADRLPELADDPDAVRVVLTVHCPSTNLRHATVMGRDPGSPGSYSAELELRRELLHSRAYAEATVAATVNGTADRYLARSNPIDIQIAALRIPEISGDLDIAWRRFDETLEGQRPLDPAMHDQLSDLELDRPDGPRLWLNDRVEGLRRLLDERPGRSPIETAMRLTVFDAIATSAMLAMFNASLATARELDENSEDPWPPDWQGATLRSLLPLMYPDRDPDDAMRTLLDELQDASAASEVQSRAHAAAARKLKINADARRAVKALEENP